MSSKNIGNIQYDYFSFEWWINVSICNGTWQKYFAVLAL